MTLLLYVTGNAICPPSSMSGACGIQLSGIRFWVFCMTWKGQMHFRHVEELQASSRKSPLHMILTASMSVSQEPHSLAAEHYVSSAGAGGLRQTMLEMDRLREKRTLSFRRYLVELDMLGVNNMRELRNQNEGNSLSNPFILQYIVHFMWFRRRVLWGSSEKLEVIRKMGLSVLLGS